MKFLILALLLTSTVSFAASESEYYNLCNPGNESSRGSGSDRYFGGLKLSLIELSSLPSKARVGTKIVCGNFNNGDYVYINPVNKSFDINFRKQCNELLESMEANPNVVYEVEVKDGNVVHVTKTDSTDCTVSGATVLDI